MRHTYQRIIVIVGVTFPLPAPVHAGPVSLQEACLCPCSCPWRDLARRAQLDGCPLDVGGLEEAVEGFASGDNVDRASSPALLLRLVSGAFCRDASLALACLCRAVDADTTGGEEVVRSGKPSRSTKSGWGHAVCVKQIKVLKSDAVTLRG